VNTHSENPAANSSLALLRPIEFSAEKKYFVGFFTDGEALATRTIGAVESFGQRNADASSQMSSHRAVRI
jgi:hypothetical protein